MSLFFRHFFRFLAPKATSCLFVLLAFSLFPSFLLAANPPSTTRVPSPPPPGTTNRAASPPASLSPSPGPGVSPSPGGETVRVVSVQLEGALVCPPLRLERDLIIAATNDRRLLALDSRGKILWTLDFMRQIKGPLFSPVPGLVFFAMAGQQVALVDRRGRLAATFPAPWKNLVLLPDGRWIALDPESSPPSLVWLNPAGSPLFALPLEVPAQGDWRLENQGRGALLSMRTQDGKDPAIRSWFINPQGRITILPSSVPLVSPAVPGSGGLGFFPGKSRDGYTLRIEAPQARLDFSSSGDLVHWMADNRDPFVCVWGDSRWKLMIFPLREPDGQARDLVPATSGQVIGNSGANPGEAAEDDEDQARSMELAYYRDLESREDSDPVGVFTRQLDLLQSGRGLAGRLDLVEDHILELYEGLSRRGDRDTRNGRQACIALLSRLPSLRTLDRVLSLLSGEKNPRVVLAWQKYLSLLPGDPSGLIQTRLNQVFQALALGSAAFARDEKQAFEQLKARLKPSRSP